MGVNKTGKMPPRTNVIVLELLNLFLAFLVVLVFCPLISLYSFAFYEPSCCDLILSFDKFTIFGCHG